MVSTGHVPGVCAGIWNVVQLGQKLYEKQSTINLFATMTYLVIFALMLVSPFLLLLHIEI